MSLLLATALLALSILFVRPADGAAWRLRVMAHGLVLAACLLAYAFASPPTLPLVGAAVVLMQTVLLARRRRTAEPATPAMSGSAGWMVAGLSAAWFAAWLLHDPGPADARHGLLVISLGILLNGLIGTAASRDPQACAGSLLLAGNGALLAACTLPGPGWTGVACLAGLQAWILSGVLARTVPGAR